MNIVYKFEIRFSFSYKCCICVADFMLLVFQIHLFPLAPILDIFNGTLLHSVFRPKLSGFWHF